MTSGIGHVGLLPNRSNQQGNVEIAIKLIRALLNKVVSLSRFGGRSNWTGALPAVVKALNDSHAYNSPLSRSSLFFSPLHHSNPALILLDPFLMQVNVLDRLNLKRIENLKNKGISKEVFPFRVGNYVLLKADLAIEGGSKSNISPKFRDVYKIVEIHSEGFGIRIKNLRTGSSQSCSHEKAHLLSLGDLISSDIVTKSFWNIDKLVDSRAYFKQGKSKNRLTLLEDSKELLTVGDQEINCQQNNQSNYHPANFGATPSAISADGDVLRNALNQSAAANQNQPEIELSLQGNDDGVMLDSPQNEENYEDIL